MGNCSKNGAITIQIYHDDGMYNENICTCRHGIQWTMDDTLLQTTYLYIPYRCV